METNTLVKIREAIQTIGTALGATVTALAMMLLPCRAATNTVVQTVDLRNVDLDSPVEIVTNVDCEALVDTNQLHIAITNLEEKIAQATPENYSVVSNAAMNALSRAEAEAGFTEWKLSGVPNGATNVLGPMWEESAPGWEVSFVFGEDEYIYDGVVESTMDATSISVVCMSDSGPGSYTVTATRTRLPTMADIPTKTSDLTNDGAPNGGGTPYVTTADATLTPVYGGNGERFSEWVVSDNDIHVGWDEDEGVWVFLPYGIPCQEPEKYNPNATSLISIPQPPITATRTENPIIGYTLGSQTNKPLQAAGDYAPATNIQKTALASAVQTSLGKADTAVQPAALAAMETNIVRATNPNFSNAVLQVSIGIDTNTVAAINALVESGDELPIGGATTVGALLLALAAAVAALKKSKADATALRYDLPANATAISSASSEVVEGETVTYGAATLADRTANRIAITAAIAELRLTFPTAVSGKVRDFGLRVEVGDGTAALTAPALVPPAGVTLENSDGAIPALADGTATAKGVTLLYFSETAPGVFLVKGEQVKEA